MLFSLKRLLVKSAKLSLLVIALCPGILFAQDEATTAPVTKNQYSADNLMGSILESVDLASGSVTLPIPLLNLPGRGGLDVSLTALYSSNVEATVRFPNITVPTGIMGVGWSLGHSRIVVDHKGTYDPNSNSYYLAAGGTVYELIRTGGSDFVQEFKTSPMESWRITYYYEDEKWEVVRNDGTIEIYGDLTSSSDAVERGIRWGNWIGDSATPGGEPYAFAWNISEIRSVTGSRVRYEYFNYREKVGTYYVHTKAAYLKRIIDSLGRTVTLHYADKNPNEYQDPHTGHPEVPEGGSGPGDAYQEYYQTLYLDSLSVTSAQNVFLQGTSFSYDLRGQTTGPAYTKRYLTAITHYTESGEALPPTDFQYLSHTHSWNPGALSKVVTSTGAEATYSYQQLQIPSSERTITATAPLGIETPRPRVFIQNNYTVITWYNEDSQSIGIRVYEWDGEWIMTEFGQSNIDLISGFQQFDIYTEDNFFVLRTRTTTRVFTRDPAVRGRWTQSSFPQHVAQWDRSQQWVATGDNFFTSVHSVSPLIIRRGLWNGSEWNIDSINLGATQMVSIYGYGNYFGIYAPSMINHTYHMAYHNHDGWSDIIDTQLFGISENVVFNSAPGYVAFRNSSNANIIDWNEDMDDFGLHLVGSIISTNYPINIVDNTIVGFEQHRVTRRDGNLGWVGQQQGYHSIGQDYAVLGINQGDGGGRYTAYNANHAVDPQISQGWQATITFLPPPEISILAQAGSGFFTLGSNVYRIPPDGSSPSIIGSLPVRFGQEMQGLSPRIGLGGFISYNELGLSRTGVAIFDGEKLITPNMGVGTHPLVVPGRRSYYHQVANQERPALTGPHTVVTYASASLHQATNLQIHRVVRNGVKGPLSRPVVSRVTINDGFEQRSSFYTYFASTARLDPSGYVVRNARVEVRIEGEPGYTRYEFHNGTTFGGACNPVTGSPFRYDLHNGLLCLTERRKEDNALIESSRTRWETFSEDIGPRVVYWTRPVEEETVTTGVLQERAFAYDTDNDRVYRNTGWIRNASGDLDEVITEYTYASEKYSALANANRRADVVQSRTLVNGEPIEATATTWWNGWSGTHIWLPRCSYVWTGEGPSIFNAWTDDAWASESILTFYDAPENGGTKAVGSLLIEENEPEQSEIVTVNFGEWSASAYMGPSISIQISIHELVQGLNGSIGSVTGASFSDYWEAEQSGNGDLIIITAYNYGSEYNGIWPYLESPDEGYYGHSVATQGGTDADQPWPSELLFVANEGVSTQFEIELWGGRTATDIRGSVSNYFDEDPYWSQNYTIQFITHQGHPALELTANAQGDFWDLLISVTSNNPFTVVEVVSMPAWPGSLVSTGNCPTVGGWQRVSKVVDRDEHGNVIEAEDVQEIASAAIWGYDGSVPIAEFARANRASVAADNFRGAVLLEDDVQQWDMSGSHWNLSGEALRWTSTTSGGSLMLEQSLGLQSFIAEYEYVIHPEFGWGTDGNLGFHFRAANSGHTPYESGYVLKHFPDGQFQLQDLTGQDMRLLAQGQLSRAVDRHRVRVAADGAEIRVYINGTEEIAVTDASNPFVDNQYIGFQAQRLNGELSQFRVYPLDAVATSTTYHPDFLRVERSTGSSGAPSFIEYDADGIAVENRRHDGLILTQQSYLEPRRIDRQFVPLTERSAYTRSFPVGNPVRNSSFELGEDSNGNPMGWGTWAPNGAVARVVRGNRQPGSSGEASFTGSHAMQLQSPTIGTPDTWYHVSSRLHTPGFLDAQTSYTVTFYLLAQEQGLLKVDLYNHVTDYDYVSTTADVPYVASSEWQRVEIELTTGFQIAWADPQNKRGYISFRVQNGAAAILIDDVELRRSDTGPQNTIVSADFLDASGRLRQTQLSEGSSLLVSQRFYDAQARNDVTSKAGRITGSTFFYRSDFALLNRSSWQMSGQIASLYPQDAGKPYTRTVFEADLLGRPIEQGFPGATHSIGGNTTTFDYFVNNASDGITNRLNLPAGVFHGSTTIDADGNRSSTIVDGAGRTIAVLGEEREALLARSIIIEAGDGVCGSSQERILLSTSEEIDIEIFVAPGMSLDDLEVRLGSDSVQADLWHYLSPGRIDTSGRSDELLVESHEMKVPAGPMYLTITADVVDEPTQPECPMYRVVVSQVSPYLRSFRPLTSYEYDERGQLIQIRPPNYHNRPLGSVSAADYEVTRAYDHFGRLIEEDTPDAGTERFAYDEYGRLRFSLDAQGADPGDNGTLLQHVRYIKYDDRNRIHEEGMVLTSWNTVHAHADDPAWPTTGADWRRRYTYFGDLEAPNVRGRLQRIISRTVPGSQPSIVEQYVYDASGRVAEARLHEVTLNPVFQVVRYTYDVAGRMTHIVYPDSSVVTYRYDAAGRLEAIGTPANAEYYAAYAYTASGTMGQVELNDGALTRTLAYDSPGRLTSIQYTTQTDRIFGQQLSYETGGYDGTGYSNGLIARNTYTFGWTGAPDDYHVAYAYDSANYLTAAQHVGSVALAEYNIGVGLDNQSLFDPNGNPQRAMLGPVGQQTERTYTYHPRTNRVASTTVRPIDYLYNPSGNMTHSETAHEDGQIDLGWDIFLNLPAEVTHPVWEQSQGTTHFTYGSNRQRVVKRTEEPGATNTTHYIHGLSAQPLSVTHCVDVTNRNECWGAAYIWGPDGLIAERHTYLGNPSDERFVVKDHLGSIRLALDADDGSVQAWRDYAPFGEVMRGADIGATLRYTYTGQEADTELGLMNYQARLYDPEIGIFLAVDPAGQVASPYAYAGNNPISFVDPDGEFFIEAMLMGAFFGARAASLNNGNVFLGATIGAVSGAVSAGVSTFASPALASYIGWHTGSVSVGVVAGYTAGGALGGMTGYGLSGILSGDRLSARGFAMAGLSSGLWSGASSAYRYHTNPEFRLNALRSTLRYGLSVTGGGRDMERRWVSIASRFFGWQFNELDYISHAGTYGGWSSTSPRRVAIGFDAFGDTYDFELVSSSVHPKYLADGTIIGYETLEVWNPFPTSYNVDKFMATIYHEALHPQVLLERYGALGPLSGQELILHEIEVSARTVLGPYFPYFNMDGRNHLFMSFTNYLRQFINF